MTAGHNPCKGKGIYYGVILRVLERVYIKELKKVLIINMNKVLNAAGHYSGKGNGPPFKMESPHDSLWY
ncbi:hypothetical protein BS1321_16705 [Peribacillus simplex NBRC 15720 = DSM 1321]|uniref:Uncharacterized protein n=1 Tax=Peribacillus simplex NBRC 15720 = DSM 1321 TaxID=1349754 RepID=A0A223EJJ9_9BACI|nr:hypothetical protein BS1321_16705 [Peribacillus simplex NBRC 15720 = DSM 1321]